jgi:FtsP/CotA-like multicopper oxidase with cupredoxin domain
MMSRLRWRLLLLPVLAGGVAAGFARTQQATARNTPCATPARGLLLPSRDLYCLELNPIPDLDSVVATFELNRIPAPFGTNVSRDGAQRYAPVLRLRGLPQPSGLEAGARVWIAWIATPTLTQALKLGEVRNGENRLPVIDWSKYVVLVTAEKSETVSEPTGRAVVRGLSPGTRLQPPDMIQFLYGAGRVDTASTSVKASEHAAHMATPAPSSGTTQWLHPVMPRGLSMMPAEMKLPPPRAEPFLPAIAGEIPNARPREMMRANDGDTIVLTAGPVRQTIGGRSFVGYGYNGQVPGPLIWAAQGATVHVRFQNRIDWPTSVHWHGVRLDNRSDGAVGLTQNAVAPGASFDYTVHLRDAGLYWYHPHQRDDVLRDLGLYGNLVVRPPSAQYAPANREEVLMLDDFEVTPEGVLPYGRERSSHALSGRFGTTLLVNGKTDWSLDVARGEVVRFYLTNTSNTRVFNISFGDARIKVLGADISPFEREEWVESVVIAPAERYTVDVLFERAGDVALENRVVAIDHVFGRFFPQVDTLGVVHVENRGSANNPSFATLHEQRATIADIDRFRRYFDRAPDKELVVRFQAEGLPFVVDRFLRFDSIYFNPVEWAGTMPMMNWNATPAEVQWILEEPTTGRRNMDIKWDFKVGDVVKIRIANPRESLHGMQHPIHFHGQRFLVLEQNGIRNTNLAWKDTFLLPAGNTADILLELSNPGSWMAHCHISEHMESGMMMSFEVR